MNPDDARAELEQDIAWREEELVLLQNTIRALPKPEDAEKAAKALIVLLYAHFEGFTKAAFEIYLRFVEQNTTNVGQLQDVLRASALAEEFKKLDDSQSKCQLFGGDIPENSKIHRLWRKSEFLKESSVYLSRSVQFEKDLIVETESNLNPLVLRKILFRSGFPPDLCAAEEGTIHQLVGRRNQIAHGGKSKGIKIADYEKVRDSVKRVIDALILKMYDAMKQQVHLAPTPP